MPQSREEQSLGTRVLGARSGEWKEHWSDSAAWAVFDNQPLCTRYHRGKGGPQLVSSASPAPRGLPPHSGVFTL